MDINLYGVALVPLIIGLVEAFKMAGLSNKYTPLFSLFLGVVLGVAFLDNGDMASNLLVGIALGLSASGLYSGTKTLNE